MLLALLACMNAWVVDGDSLRCGGRRAAVGVAGRATRGAYVGEVRLLGIDAPDFVDSPPCRGHYGDHVCDDAADRIATRALIRVVAPRRSAVRLEGVGRDRYGRLLAIAWAGGSLSRLHPNQPDGGINLNCWQLAHHVARYIAAYDNGGRIARACRGMR